jgi:hypothetical protein
MLQERSSRLGQVLDTPNASMGRVAVDRYRDGADLVPQVAQQVGEAIAAAKGPDRQSKGR